MSLKLGSSTSTLFAGSSVVKQMLIGTSPKFAAPILDHVPNAAAAYSLRRLSNSFAGPVVKVRRSSDSTLADFTSDEVADGTLAAWCGAGDGLVDTWYDQSGNERDATQTTAGSQPKLVSSGVVVTEGGKPALSFDGVNDRLKSAFALSNRLCLFGVARMDATNDFVFDGYGPDPNTCSIWSYSATQLRFLVDYGSSQRYMYRPFSLGSQFAFSLTNTSDEVLDAYINGSNTETQAGTTSGSGAAMNGVSLGCSGIDGHFLLGTISEIVVYESDMTASRELAEGEMAWHYGLQAKLPYDHAYAPQAIGGSSQRVPVDSDAIDYLSRLAAADGEAVENSVALAIDDFVVGCKADGTWSAIQACCVMAGARTISGALVPLKGTAPTGYNWVSADYSRSLGLKGGGLRYLDIHRTNDSFGVDDVHVSTFSTSLATTGTQYIGSGRTSGEIGIQQSAVVMFAAARGQYAPPGSTPTVGFQGVSRSNATTLDYSFPATAGSAAVVSVTATANPVYVYKAGPHAEYSDARLAFYSIGSSVDLALLDARVSALVAAISAALP